MDEFRHRQLSNSNCCKKLLFIILEEETDNILISLTLFTYDNSVDLDLINAKEINPIYTFVY